MAFRRLFQEATERVTVRVPRSTLERIDAEHQPSAGGRPKRPDPNRQHRSRTVAMLLEDFLERSAGEVQSMAAQEERRAALKVVVKERNDYESRLAATIGQLKEERAKHHNMLRSLRMALRNMPTADRVRIAGCMRRIKDQMASIGGLVDEGYGLQERLRSAQIEREPDRGRVMAVA
jgi:hypothetical protein